MEEHVLVVVPHSGVGIPSEVPMESLAEDFSVLAEHVDWHTNWLYDFRDLLEARHLVFPYCSLVLEANRDPDILDESVPLHDVRGRSVYRPGAEPSRALRADMAARYLKAFHRRIEEDIASGATFLFDGHATVTARGVADNQIDLMHFQHAPRDRAPLRYCPDVFVETYAAELRKRLPGVEVTVNGSTYWQVHGHVCAAHGIDAMARVGSRVPAFLQETNMRIYTGADGRLNLVALNRLRRAFAESLGRALRLVGKGEKGTHHD